MIEIGDNLESVLSTFAVALAVIGIAWAVNRK